MNRLCTKLRQRLTPDDLNQLMLISQEGPVRLVKKDLSNIIYISGMTRSHVKFNCLRLRKSNSAQLQVQIHIAYCKDPTRETEEQVGSYR